MPPPPASYLTYSVDVGPTGGETLLKVFADRFTNPNITTRFAVHLDDDSKRNVSLVNFDIVISSNATPSSDDGNSSTIHVGRDKLDLHDDIMDATPGNSSNSSSAVVEKKLLVIFALDFVSRDRSTNPRNFQKGAPPTADLHYGAGGILSHVFILRLLF